MDFIIKVVFAFGIGKHCKQWIQL